MDETLTDLMAHVNSTLTRWASDLDEAGYRQLVDLMDGGGVLQLETTCNPDPYRWHKLLIRVWCQMPSERVLLSEFEVAKIN